MEKKQKKNRICFTGAWITAFMIIALDLMFFVFPKVSFSENENRYLEKLPRVSVESIKSGKLMEDINSYLCDHFPFRDGFMTVRTELEMWEGRKEVNGIYLAKDDYLIEPYAKPENTDKIIQAWSKFYQKIDENIEVKLMLVPSAVWTLKDKLPENAPWRDQKETADRIARETGISTVDCFAAMSEAAAKGTQQLYYKTDHHWTTYGAYAGYKAYCEALSLEPVPLEDWECTVVTTQFRGTIFSKLNDNAIQGDEITAFSYPKDRLSVVYEDTMEESNSLYNEEYLAKKDKYSYFLDNVHSLITITNENAESDRELVLIKDSYANSAVPFLSHHFKKIYVFDTRSYKFGPSAFIKEHAGVTDVLILYNLFTLDGDLGIGGIF